MGTQLQGCGCLVTEISTTTSSLRFSTPHSKNVNTKVSLSFHVARSTATAISFVVQNPIAQERWALGKNFVVRLNGPGQPVPVICRQCRRQRLLCHHVHVGHSATLRCPSPPHCWLIACWSGHWLRGLEIGLDSAHAPVLLPDLESLITGPWSVSLLLANFLRKQRSSIVACSSCCTLLSQIDSTSVFQPLASALRLFTDLSTIADSKQA